jgi:hypothetical protein
MLNRPADTATPTSEAPTIGPAIQTGITLVLIIHLTSMLFGILGTNFVPGGNPEEAGEPIEFSSRLERQLAGGVPGLHNYRQLFQLNKSNAISRADILDTNHRLEIELRDGRNGDPASREVARVELPPTDITSNLRRHRYEVLATTIAQYAGNENAEAVIPRGIAAGLLERYAPEGATWLTFRCLGVSPLQTPEQFQAGENPDRPELWRNEYEAQIWKSGDDIRLMKRETARGDNAPAAEPSGPATTVPSASTNPTGAALPPATVPAAIPSLPGASNAQPRP